MENQDFKHIMWPSIEGFQHVYKNVKTYPDHYPQPDPDCSIIQYVPKVKLHGTNAAIQCKNGKVVAQSRETLLVNGADNSGFARWVAETEEYWKKLSGFIFFGEWVGPGIQKNVAVNQLPTKCFAIFAMLFDGVFEVAPTVIQPLVEEIPNTYVLPWYTQGTISVDWWNDTPEQFKKVTNFIDSEVKQIEECDPWVMKIFGARGTGEGLVFYPRIDKGNNWENFEKYAFKAKGEKHRVVRSEKAATIEPEVAKNVDEFVELVLPKPRLTQGATTVNNGSSNYSKKATGAFVAWILADVQKETQAELEAAGLTWVAVQKALTAAARKWYLAEST